MASRPSNPSAWLVAALCAWLTTVGAAPAAGADPAPATTTTSSTQPAATISTSDFKNLSTSTTAPTLPATTTSSTTPAATTTTLDPRQLADLIHGLDADIAQAQAIDDFVAARAAAANAAAGQAVPPSADPVLVSVAASQLRAATAQAAARQRFAAARHRIGRVAVALYLGEEFPPPGTTPTGLPDRSVFLAGILQDQQRQAKQAIQAIAQATAAFDASRSQAERLVQARTVQLQALAVQAAGAARQNAAAPAPAPAPAATGTGTGGAGTTRGSPLPNGLIQQSPSILGPSVLTADELAGWYRASGHQPRLTVALETLTTSYTTVGATDGVRADVAFAQSMVETGYFNFPAYGQVAVADNNFAGIGACDSCATGLHFPDAATGVNAQMQLLHAYATTTQSVAGPLPGPFSVSGCCPTWMQLAGVWATALDYGVKILQLYRAMVLWAVAHRRRAARL